MPIVTEDDGSGDPLPERWKSPTEMKFLPCPFCGVLPVTDHGRSFGENYVDIFCDNSKCSVTCETRDYTLELAADAWNRRAG